MTRKERAIRALKDHVHMLKPACALRARLGFSVAEHWAKKHAASGTTTRRAHHTPPFTAPFPALPQPSQFMFLPLCMPSCAVAVFNYHPSTPTWLQQWSVSSYTRTQTRTHILSLLSNLPSGEGGREYRRQRHRASSPPLPPYDEHAMMSFSCRQTLGVVCPPFH